MCADAQQCFKVIFRFPRYTTGLDSRDSKMFFRLKMNVKEELVEVKTEIDDGPQEECKRCHRRFYGPLMLGRHLIKQECTKPDIKPLFEPSVKTASITILSSSDDDEFSEPAIILKYLGYFLYWADPCPSIFVWNALFDLLVHLDKIIDFENINNVTVGKKIHEKWTSSILMKLILIKKKVCTWGINKFLLKSVYQWNGYSRKVLLEINKPLRNFEGSIVYLRNFRAQRLST